MSFCALVASLLLLLLLYGNPPAHARRGLMRNSTPGVLRELLHFALWPSLFRRLEAA